MGFRDYKEKIAMRFNISQLERTIIVLLNNGFNKKFAANVSRLFNLFTEESYRTDFEKEVRVYLIKKIAKGILEKDITTKEAILSFLDLSGKYEDDAVNILNDLFELTIEDNELKEIDKMISHQLKYSIIGNESTELADKLANLQAENYEDFEKFIQEFHNSVDGMNKSLRSVSESIEDSRYDVSLGNDSFINVLDKIIKEDRNPSSKVKTGIRAINEIFDGGYEKARVYLALGLAKGWKSGFLLNSALWAIKYNKLQTKNSGLKPVVVYLTMENNVTETIKRIWSHFFGNNVEISKFEPVEAARMLEQQRIFTPNRPELAELIIWHRNTKSINTADMNALLDDLEKDGKECVNLHEKRTIKFSNCGKLLF